MVNLALIVAGGFFIGFVILCLMVFSWLSFNIPVTILRYMGSKERPLMIQRKARKRMIRGIPMLQIRGYKDPIRDYLSENYYPAFKTKYGGLILWEFEDGLLTPALPHIKKMSDEERKKTAEAMKTIGLRDIVGFEFDDKTYHQLRLKTVDDVDVEFNLQQLSRIDAQYSGGWRDFFSKYTGHIVVLIIAVLLLTGLIIWLDKMPEFAAQCYGAASQAVEQGYLERAAEAIRPAG